MKKVHVPELDILRAIAALAVITIHVTAYFVEMPHTNTLQQVLAYIDNIAWFAVPCFIFISGLVLYKNYSEGPLHIWQFYKKRFGKILPIYTFFSLLYMLLPEVKAGLFQNSYKTQWDIGTVLYKLLTGGGSYHLWYFGLLFQFYLLFPVFLKLYQRYRLIFLGIVFLLQLLWHYEGYPFMDILLRFAGSPGFYFPLCFSHMFWFVAGFYFIEHKEEILHSRYTGMGVLFLLILVLNTLRVYPVWIALHKYTYENIPASYYALPTFINPFYYIFEILFFYKAAICILNSKNYVTRVLEKIGFYSLEIYLIHAGILILLATWLYPLHITCETWVFYPVAWITTLLISYLLAVIYKTLTGTLKKVLYGLPLAPEKKAL